jgi:multidrug resistance efflux pump
VTEGQLLAKLDVRELNASREELLAQLAEAEAAYAELQAGPRRFEKAASQDRVEQLQSNLALTRTQLERRRTLFESGAIPKEDLDVLESEEQSLVNQLQAAKNQVRDLDAGARPESRQAGRARVEQVRASLDSLNVRLQDSLLKAPFAGTIAERLLDEGAIVTAGEPVFELVTEQQLEVEVFLPPERAEELSVGDVVTLSSKGAKQTARVADFLPNVNTATGTRGVLLTLPEDGSFQPGELVRLNLGPARQNTGYWLPTTALLPGERGLFQCYTVEPVEGEENLFEVKKQAVEIIGGKGEKTFVRGTLTGDTRVITDGVQRVVPGQRVRLR